MAQTKLLGSRAALAMLIVLVGCTKWVVQPLAPLPRKPPEPSSLPEPVEVRITLTSGAVVATTDPWVQHDSLLWVPDSGDATHPTGVPLTTIKEVRVHKGDLGNSLLLTFGVLSVVLGGLALWIGLAGVY